MRSNGQTLPGKEFAVVHMARWFIVGVLALALLVAVAVTGFDRMTSDATAQGTWQVELFDTSSINNGALNSDPDRFVDDWIRTLPVDCDIVPIQTEPLMAIAYRCPD